MYEVPISYSGGDYSEGKKDGRTVSHLYGTQCDFAFSIDRIGTYKIFYLALIIYSPAGWFNEIIGSYKY